MHSYSSLYRLNTRLCSKMGCPIIGLSDQAQNIELSVNKQETTNSAVYHMDSTKIALPSGSKGRMVFTSVAK